MAMLHPAVDDDWDRQIKADVAAGRLDRLDPMVLEGASAARAGDTRHPNASRSRAVSSLRRFLGRPPRLNFILVNGNLRVRKTHRLGGLRRPWPAWCFLPFIQRLP
jgi:hypothetical protein